MKNFKALNFAFDLGFLILVPIILFGLIGKILDNYFNSFPFGLLLGIIISIVLSSILIYKKAVKILNSE